MNSLIMALCCGGGAAGTYFACNALKSKGFKLGKKEIKFTSLIFSTLSVLLFACFLLPQFWLNAMTLVEVAGLQGTLFSKTGYILLGALEGITAATVALAIVAPFFPKKEVRDFAKFLAIPILLINVVFIEKVVLAHLGTPDMSSFKARVICARIVLAAMICGKMCIEAFVELDFKDVWQRLGRAAIFFSISLIAFVPTYYPQLILGRVGETPEGFIFMHRLFIYPCFILPLLIYFAYRHRSEADRHFIVVFLALSGIFQYFSYAPHRYGAAQFPLHLCNTAMIMMVFAYVFRIRGLYYFTYFINVLGAFIAVVMPDLSSLATSTHNITYWYNHAYAFFLPLLGVALGVFPRPKFKMMGGPIIVFTMYVAFVFFTNCYLNSPFFEGRYNADYFYLYSDFILDKAGFLKPLKYDFIWEFTMFGKPVVGYPVLALGVYVTFVALTFVIWGFYMLIFHVSDSHRQLAYRKKLQRVDHLNLLKELDGRPQNTPLHPEGANMVKISHFSKTYAGSDKKSVDDLSLEIHDGEVFGFIGHNGAGKSTTIKSLVGIQSITEGSIEVEGYDIARQPLEAKLRLGYVSDNHALYEKLTGREYINYVADLYMVSEEDKKARIDKYLKLFRLEDAIDREIKSYSHGMKQKCMVISALIHNPKVWVLDEPLTGLDPTSSWQIKECMRQHADEGNIVFFSSHVIEVVEKICDRIAIISGGKIRRVSTIEEIKKEGVSLEQLYLQYAQQQEVLAQESAKETAEVGAN